MELDPTPITNKQSPIVDTDDTTEEGTSPTRSNDDVECMDKIDGKTRIIYVLLSMESF